jgi:hypothetical protein
MCSITAPGSICMAAWHGCGLAGRFYCRGRSDSSLRGARASRGLGLLSRNASLVQVSCFCGGRLIGRKSMASLVGGW